MKKKIFFVMGSLHAGGAERVYWLLSQYLNKASFDVSLVVLDCSNAFFATDLPGVRVIDLKTPKASRSFGKLLKLMRKEKPYAVFTTGNHITALLSLISLFVKIPVIIGRETNVLEILVKFQTGRDRLLNRFLKSIYKRINIGICQSNEVKASLQNHFGIKGSKLVIIPNPVELTSIIRDSLRPTGKRLIVVARLDPEKGHLRLLEIMKNLPSDYTLTIVGEGSLRKEIETRIETLQLQNRVKLLGRQHQIQQLISEHDLMVLPSYTEGFPNVVIESLAVGIPVISYKVSGVSAIIHNGFNGYIIEQDDQVAFCRQVQNACTQLWDHAAIKDDVISRFGIEKVVAQYESLIA